MQIRRSMLIFAVLILCGTAEAQAQSRRWFNDLRRMTRTPAPNEPEARGPEEVANSAYLGQPLVTLLDGEKIRLERDFGYRDSGGRWWPVPAKLISDGASIPRIFWSATGGPLDGPYRNAAIIHDYYCDTMTRSWHEVHRMFYDAMIASGVNAIDAKLKYYAVYRFGPRWYYEGGRGLRCSIFNRCAQGPTPKMPVRLAVENVDLASAGRDEAIIRSSNPDLKEIEKLADIAAANGG